MILRGFLEMSMKRRSLLTSILMATMPYGLMAQTRPELRFGLSTLPTSMDPHFHNLQANLGPQRQLFEPLLAEDENARLIPCLAESWRLVAEDIWEFDLRRDVRFHDGTPFNAQDVAFSMERIPKVPNSPGLYTTYLSSVRRVEVMDTHRLRIHTPGPAPFLLRQLPLLCILSASLHADAATADFNNGKLAIGTGPYRFGSFVPGQRMEVLPYDGWWGGTPAWGKVSMRQIPNGSGRIAALLSNDLDLIEAVPFADLASLRENPQIGIFAAKPSSLYYIALDSQRDVSPQVQGPNALKDVRVRQALSLAIDRKAIVQRIMDGQAEAANQFAPAWADGFDASLPELAYDPARARALLADAGFANGFTMKLHGTQGWVAQDGRVLQAIAQYWTRIGVRTEVETFPVANYLQRATQREFSAFFGSSGGSFAAHHMRGLLSTRDPAQGNGTLNRLLYSNKTVDEAIAAAYRTVDDKARNAFLAEASRAALQDAAVLPIILATSQWAGRKSFVSYKAPVNSHSNASLAVPARAG